MTPEYSDICEDTSCSFMKSLITWRWHLNTVTYVKILHAVSWSHWLHEDDIWIQWHMWRSFTQFHEETDGMKMTHKGHGHDIKLEVVSLFML